MNKKTVLVADDDAEIVSLLRLYLESEGMTVIAANDGEAAYKAVESEKIDLALVDIMMPKLNGFELIKKLRATYSLPVLVISARTELSDRVLGLDLGADDYISKPFEPLEVVAKVKAHLRRADLQKARNDEAAGTGTSGNVNNTGNILCFENLVLNLDSCTITADNVTNNLTKAEFLVLKMFMEQPNRVFTKEQVYECGWSDVAVDDNTIRVIISRLRDKIGTAQIKTIRGLGYRLEKGE